LTAFDLPAGTVFGDDFKVISPLSRGGMGAVYVVEQVSTKKRRALKLMLAARASDPEMRKRFEQEAKVGAMIPSEHVVDVIAAGIDSKSQVPWLAMELLDGEDLESFGDRRGTLTPVEVYEIFSQLCHALAAAHAIPIVHRDLKPGNIFLARPRLAEARPIVKVLDFGIAKIVGAAPSTTAALGTPLWMAPEQSEPRAPINPAADVWALGLIAFRLLTGRIYWVSANDPDKPALSVVREVLFEPLVSATDRAKMYGVAEKLPAGFDAWFAKCVTRDLATRFAEAGTAWSALKDVLVPARPMQTSGSALSDVRVSTGDARTSNLTGLASTLMATPSPTTGQPPSSDQPASATLDAVGQTLAREREKSRRVQSQSRMLVGALIAVIAVLAIGAGALVLLRDPARPPAVAASGTTSAPVAPSASVSPPAPEPSASTAAAPSTTATVSAKPIAGHPPPNVANVPTGPTARPSATNKPEPTAAPPPPRPTASTPFLL
jgi:serine/threonine protein kinase